MKLNQECTLLQNELRKFAGQVILEKVDEFDKAGNFPMDNIKQLAEMGILGAIIPEDMGGAALDTIGLVVSLEEISKVCASTALIIAVHNAFFAYPILKFGSEEMKKKYLPLAATGEIIGGFADINTNEIEIKKQGEAYILNGKNPFVLNAEANGPIVTFLPTSEDQKNISAFIIENGAPGIKKNKNSSIIGIKTSGVGEIVFENYSTAQTSIIGTASSVLKETRDLARIYLAAISLGIAQGAIESAIKYATERVQFNEPIINFGMIREKIADAVTKIEASRLLTYDAAMKCDAHENFSGAAAMAKCFAGQTGVEITTSAIQIYGGYGYMKDYPVERYFRDAQVINVICSTPVEDKEHIVKEVVG